MQQPGRDMEEVTGLGAVGEFAALTPPQLASALQHEGDRLLQAMMMHINAPAGGDREQAAPETGRDSPRPRHGGEALGSAGLRGRGVEFAGADDADCGREA